MMNLKNTATGIAGVPQWKEYMGSYTAGKAWKEAKRQHILETAFRLFAERGIERVTLPEVAAECGIGHATLHRYFNTKQDLVAAINAWKWKEYINNYSNSVPADEIERMTGAEFLKFYMDFFLILYREHRDILRFNYEYNSFVRNSQGASEEEQQYIDMMKNLMERFHRLYERGSRDGTLNTEISEKTMFSSSFHIMIAAVTRYAVGLTYIPDGESDPENELIMLEELMVNKFVK